MEFSKAAFDQQRRAVAGGSALPTDFELVSRARKGDEAAFELIMRRYNRRLYRLARSIVKNERDAEELVQETYVRVFTHLDSFRGPAGFAAWISKIVINESLGFRKRAARIVSLEEYLDKTKDGAPSRGLDLASKEPGPQRLTENIELGQLLENAVEQLPLNFRTVFILREIEGLSIAETAECLCIPPQTVKTRLHRAKRQLQDSLGNNGATLLASTFDFGGNHCDRIVANVFSRLELNSTG